MDHRDGFIALNFEIASYFPLSLFPFKFGIIVPGTNPKKTRDINKLAEVFSFQGNWHLITGIV